MYMVHNKIIAHCDTFKIVHIIPQYFIKTHNITLFHTYIPVALQVLSVLEFF